MKIFRNKIELLKEISNVKNIAFVPTMGSIHDGHLSLINKANKISKNILVSIYVNPKQFDTGFDYKRYPRNINKDIALLKKVKVKFLYLPDYKDLYSFVPKLPIYLNKFSQELCGKFRPRHFKGVINVINRFIEILKPSLILLGRKDFQQLTLIKLHIKKNNILTKVVSCPTIREINGVALSSRNLKLNKSQIKTAAQIYKYLKKNKRIIFSKNLKKQQLEIEKNIKFLGAEKIDYIKFINLKTLKEPKIIKEKYNVFVAYYLGGIRLIDNL